MSRDVRNFSWLEIIGILILVLAIIGSIIAYIVTLAKLPFAQKSSDFGTFGDYVGGIVGTIVGLISIIFLYRTYRIQLDISAKQELKQQSQQFESAFFLPFYYNKEIYYKISKEILLKTMEHII